MLHDRGDAQRRVSTGDSGAAPSAGVGQLSPASRSVPRIASCTLIGPTASGAGASAGSMVDGTGLGGSPVPGEL